MAEVIQDQHCEGFVLKKTFTLRQKQREKGRVRTMMMRERQVSAHLETDGICRRGIIEVLKRITMIANHPERG